VIVVLAVFEHLTAEAPEVAPCDRVAAGLGRQAGTRFSLPEKLKSEAQCENFM
jgi:hypothetical protein